MAAPTTFTSRQFKANLTLQQATDYYLFNTTIDQFIRARTVRDGAAMGLDWTADGCSSSPDDPFGFDFHNSCLRHDFGYRNYKLQKRCGKAKKKKIDRNFKKDMFAECAEEEDEDVRDVCEGVAELYYGAVRIFGATSFCG